MLAGPDIEEGGGVGARQLRATSAGIGWVAVCDDRIRGWWSVCVGTPPGEKLGSLVSAVADGKLGSLVSRVASRSSGTPRPMLLAAGGSLPRACTPLLDAAFARPPALDGAVARPPVNVGRLAGSFARGLVMSSSLCSSSFFSRAALSRGSWSLVRSWSEPVS